MGYWSTLAVMVILVIAVKVLVVVRMATALVRRYRAFRGSGTRAWLRLVCLAALAYAAWPWDLLAEPNLFDDIVVLVVALRGTGNPARRARDSGAAG